MSKERYNQIIDEVYENYVNWVESPENQNNKNEIVKIPVSKEDFIKTIKGNDEIVKKMGKRYCDKFSQEWGLKIEERVLSLEERKTIYENEYAESMEVPNNHWLNSKLTTRNIPTKIVTLTHNNETAITYE